MITRIRSEKMVIVSDLHLGNPFSSIRKKAVNFIQWASSQGYDICINGDGFEISQASLSRFSQDVPDVLRALKQAMKDGTNVYYVVGNHDIFFEHFLNDWGSFKMAPFLNVESGGKRFRVEHGHLYDPFFVKFPKLYEFSTWLGGFILKLHPGLYRAWIALESLRSRLRGPGEQGITGEPKEFYAAAKELSLRGFDGIVFGHTHHSGEEKLSVDAIYLNPGSFMLSSTYVEIRNGRLCLSNFKERREAFPSKERLSA